MSDLANLPRPSLASECTESLASRPLDGASAGGMPVGRVEFSPSPPAGFPGDAADAAMLIAKHFKADPESRIAAAVAAERESIRLELLVEAERLDEFRLGAGAAALRDFARRLEPVTASAYVDGRRLSATARTPEEADTKLTRLAGLEPRP